MIIWILCVVATTLLPSGLSKTIFFEELTSHPIYKTNHMYKQIDAVLYRDSIMYVQDQDYLLISSNYTIVNLDLYTLKELQKLTVYPSWSPNLCYVDPYATEYPCHLFGYWSKVISFCSDPGASHLFVCHNDGKASLHDLQNLGSYTQSNSGCLPLSVFSTFASDSYFYVFDVKTYKRISRFHVRSRTNELPTKRKLSTFFSSKWLQQNDYLQFVLIFENDNFVYFLFRETAEEDISYCHAKGVKSRVARISKDDNGLSKSDNTKNWITFVKATIICFDDDTTNLDSSLRYLEAAYFDSERKFLYTTFSSGRSGPQSSAVCQYSINDINIVLDGLYMNTDDPRKFVPTSVTDCPTLNEDCQQRRVLNYQMKFSQVLPNARRSFVRHFGEIWTHIQVMTIDRSSRQYEVVFVATSNNKIKKFYRQVKETFLCYSETLSLFEDEKRDSSIRDMKIINARRHPQLFLLVTVSDGVYKVGVEHCLIHLTEYLCLDPFCYWESSTSTCKSIFNLEVYKLRQLPQLTKCTDGTEFYDPIWKEWSSWKTNNDGKDSCDIRTRECKEGACINTKPAIEIQVKNCSQHNKWSSWSTWSACSSTCGPGVATRKRSCFQNARCLGDDSESRVCLIDNQCRRSNVTEDLWSEWSKCSTDCGDGISIRTKPCSFAEGSYDSSCKLVEHKKCVGSQCREFSKFIYGDLKDGLDESLYFARCSGNVSSAEDISVSVEYEEDKRNDTSDFIWECWSEWSNCSAYCSGSRPEDFQRIRTRRCKVEDPELARLVCLGRSTETDMCKDENCLNAMMVGTNPEKGFQLVYILLVGVATFTITCLLVIMGVCIYFEKKKPITKMTSLTNENNTIRRQPTYMRNSYSPITHSPQTSPSYREDVYLHDGYNSINRRYNIPYPAPIYMAPPQIPESISMTSMH